jgi:hypothetical protein
VTYTKKLSRKLSAGIYGRLEFDFACNRGHGFSEAYLYGVMMEILASNLDPSVAVIHPSHPAPEIQRLGGGSGRKREVDFVVVDRQEPNDLRLCIEAKWAASSHTTPDNILADVTRLALMSAANPDALCLFVLAGVRADVTRQLAKGVLAPHGDEDDPKRLLRYPELGGPSVYRLVSTRRRPSVLPATTYRKLAKRVPTIPDRVRTSRYKPSHEDPPDWSVEIWRVMA